MPIDPFTRERLKKWLADHRKKTGQLPTLTDFESAHFDRSVVEMAVREKLIEEFYVTQTNGVIRKGYKLVDQD
jgi:hypothetical protein